MWLVSKDGSLTNLDLTQCLKVYPVVAAKREGEWMLKGRDSWALDIQLYPSEEAARADLAEVVEVLAKVKVPNIYRLGGGK